MKKLFIMAWRNIRRNKRRTAIALIAIALGLVFLTFMDGAIVGFQQAIFGNAVRLKGGNVQVHPMGYREKAKRLPLIPLEDAEFVVRIAQEQPNVISASRRINTGGFVSSREATLPVVITGIEPEMEASVGLLAENITLGRYLSAGDEDVLLIGKALAARLDVSVGDRVTLVGRATHEQMRRRAMNIIGIYDLGLPEAEKRMAYVSLFEAQTLFDLRNQATEVVVSLESVGQEREVTEALQAALPTYEVDSWQELNPEMKQSLDVDKQMMNIFGMVVLLIAGLGVLNLMLMAVFERTREIGLLAAMGLDRQELLVLFLLEGVLIGLLGALFGGVLGGLIVSIIGEVGIEFASAAEMGEMMALMGDRLYPMLSIDLLLKRALTIVIISALASLFPAWQASRREPAEALHFV
jgi:ABC-type lipoprotein release transport system permease subunit